MDSKKYSQKIIEELGIYKDKVNIHELPDIFHYWSNKYLLPLIKTYGFVSITDIYVYYITEMCRRTSNDVCKVVSIGAGNCEAEVEIAVALVKKGVVNFEFTCLDINDDMLERGSTMALNAGVVDYFRFENVDLNHWSVQESYHIIFAFQCLHHFVNLEAIFDNLFANLRDDGYFIFHDMFGRNGHMRWPEAKVEIDKLWHKLSDKYKYNHQLSRFEREFLDWDCSNHGFEGIRAQDILPLLSQKFETEMFIFWGGIIDVFVDRGFGYNYSIQNKEDLYFIDEVEFINRNALLSGQVTPTQGIAVLTKDVPRRKLCLYGRDIKDCIRMVH